jgi:UDP-N-acetylglucosamine---dolichyl-phosphate N-acetylglucosaminyltransferase
MINDMYKNILLIIPAYNEATTIGNVISELKIRGFNNIVVINDGSTDSTSIEARKAGAQVIDHLTNIGLGGALATGFEYAKKTHYKHIITVDADGQHLSNDVKEMAKFIENNKFDLVLGNRLHDMTSRNTIRWIGNSGLDFFTYLIAGQYIRDTQSGLRGFQKHLLDRINIQSSGYECSSEIIAQCVKNKAEIGHIRIASEYTEYSVSKGQNILNGINILFRLGIRSVI